MVCDLKGILLWELILVYNYANWCWKKKKISKGKGLLCDQCFSQ